MNAMYQHDEIDDERLAGLIGQCDREQPALDPDFENRLRENVLQQTRAEPGRAPMRRPLLRPLARFAAAAGVAVAVLTAFWLQTPSTWAQVQEAMRSKPWIHLSARLPGGQTRENWISVPQQKIAFRVGPIARYVDMRADLQFDYEQSRGTVVRTPRRADRSPESVMAVFERLMQGQSPDVDEVDHSKVLETRSRKVVEDGKEWLDVELTLQPDSHDHSSRMLARLEFRVDPESKLPQTMTLTVIDPGPNELPDAPRQLKYEIDYPAEGPVDIYAIGVPRDVRLDDRVPPAETAGVVKALAAGRRDFDPYFAIVFTHCTDPGKPFSGFPSHLVWREGNRVRVEIGFPIPPLVPYSQKPDGTDDLTWWKEQIKTYRFSPVVVCDGNTAYAAELGEPDHKGHQPVTRWKPIASIRRGESLDETHMGPGRATAPEFFAYPMVVASDMTGIALEPAATPAQPLGALLTYSINTGQSGVYQRMRYWLDGDRGYVATHSNIDRLNVAREQAIEQKLCVEDDSSMQNLRRSPKGFWYPTLVVRSVAFEPDEVDGQRILKQQTSTAFLLDFKAELPDSLFTTRERDGAR